MNADLLQASLLELIRRTSAELSPDVIAALARQREVEESSTSARFAMDTIAENIVMAREKSAPICQDTGSILFYVKHPLGFNPMLFREKVNAATVLATQKGYLRQNSVDSLSGVNDGTNLGPDYPVIYFDAWEKPHVEVRLMLKGGGCENVGAQYALPHTALKAGRDLEGVRRVVLDAVFQAQGKGCGPGILGVCIGGDRGTGYSHSKKQFLRWLDDASPNPELAKLEETIVEQANSLGIGPMGFGGKTTLLGCKIGVLNRLPASFYVSVSYMCWAFRRQGVVLDATGGLGDWLYSEEKMKARASA